MNRTPVSASVIAPRSNAIARISRSWYGSLLPILLLSMMVLAGRAANAQNINTVAGGGPNNMPAVSANTPSQGVAADAAGNVYIGAGIFVFKVDTSGKLTIFAGNGVEYYDGDGGPATSASIWCANITLDSSGNLFIADRNNARIRRVDASTGIITTVAGNGTVGYAGDGGPATSAELNNPQAVAVDSSGNIFIADSFNNRVRRVDASTGIITTVAGTGVATYNGDNIAATTASLSDPLGVGIDPSGNLIIADSFNLRVRMVNKTTQVITTIAGNGGLGYSGDGGPATSAELQEPYDIAYDGSGSLIIADTYNCAIRRVDAITQTITTIAGQGEVCSYSGDGGPATSATLDVPTGIAVNGNNILISDNLNWVVRNVDGSGDISTFAGNGTIGFSGDNGPATDASLYNPEAVATDSAGNMYISDAQNNRIRYVDATTGVITTLAGSGSQFYSGDNGPAISAGVPSPEDLKLNGGYVYFLDLSGRVRRINLSTGVIATYAGDGTLGYSGDNGPATSAELDDPTGIALDSSGNLWIADFFNEVIRYVNASTGIITTVVGNGTPGYAGDGGPAIEAEIQSPGAIAVDGSGNLFIADNGNSRIRRVDAVTGVITTYAGNGTPGYSGDGGPATSAEFQSVSSLAIDAAGDLYLCDNYGERIRKVDAATLVITTVAGTGAFEFTGDGGPATEADLAFPGGIFVDGSGNLFIADTNSFGSGRIREVPAPKSGGNTVQVTVGTNPGGLSFTVDGTGYSSTQTLTWTVGTSHTIATTSPQDLTGTQYTFASWSDAGALSHSVTASTGTTSYTATFNATAYQLTTAASPAGDGTVSPATGTYYAPGTVVPLSATANTGYSFSSWTGSVASSTSASTTVTMNAPETVTANFTQAQAVQVTVGTSPSGLSFTVDGTTYSSTQTLSWTAGTSHTIATTSPQTSSGTQYAFAAWSDAGALSHSVTASTGTTSYTATFNATAYQLTTAASPAGDGTVSPATGTYYAAGTVVPLSATANTGYSFSSWTGSVANSTSASTTVTMNAPQSVTASFTAASMVKVTVGTSPSGLSFTVDGTTYSSTQTLSWTAGTSHTIATTSPQDLTGTQYTFAAWSDAGALSHSVSASTGVINYTATFNATAYQLTTAASPAGDGTVSPATGTYYAPGTVVPLSATANAGYSFSSWTGSVASSTSASTTVTMNAPQSVNANFQTSAAKTVQVKICTNPSGLVFSVDGTTYSSPQTLTWNVGSSHTIATTSPQTSGGTRDTFLSWSDKGAISHSVTASSSSTSYTASFSTSYLLTTGVSPAGTGTVSPSSGTYYAAGTVVPLSATPKSGYKFSRWTGNVASPGSASTSVTMSAPETVVADFTSSASASTTTTLRSSLNPACPTDTVTFTATVTSASGTPSGTVEFLEGTKVLGTATLAKGKASLSTRFAVGTYSITAAYEGATGYQPSVSTSVSQVVRK